MNQMNTVSGTRYPGSGLRTAIAAAGLALAALAAVSAQGKPAATPTSRAGNGTLYIGTYKGEIQIYDEATEKLDGSIVLKTGLPRSLTPSQDRTRFYVLDSTFEKLEVVDIATRKTLNTFKLSSGNKHMRVTQPARPIR